MVKAKRTARARTVVAASCTSEDIARIDRQAQRLRKVVEMEPTRAAVLLIAARKGLEVMEKEARAHDLAR